VVVAEIDAPQHPGVASVFLYDDGLHGDGAAHDGNFAATYHATSNVGSYTVHYKQLRGACVRRVDQTITFASSPDIDQDGLADWWQTRWNIPTGHAALDEDFDGLSNLDEFAAGTRPDVSDTDRGGESDASEIAAGRDPHDPTDDLIGTPHLTVLPGNGRVLLQAGVMLGNGIQLEVREGPTAAGPFTPVLTTTQLAPLVQPITASNDTQHCYVARQVSGTVTSGWSNVECAVPSLDPNPPVATGYGLAGAVNCATSSTATVNITAEDRNLTPRTHDMSFADPTSVASGVDSIRSLAATGWGAWQPFTGSLTLDLGSDSYRALSFQLRDAAGNESKPYSLPVYRCSSSPPHQGILKSVSLGLGDDYACGVEQSAHNVFCWGYNGDQELGDGTSTDQSTAVQTLEVTGAVKVAAGSSSACAVDSGGGVSCWGWNGYHQLSTGAPLSTSSTAVSIPISSSTATDVAVGYQHSCAVVGGSVECWGSCAHSQLGAPGYPYNNDSATPVNNTLISDAVQISASPYMTCVTRSTGGVLCWGDSQFGNFGDGATSGISATPVAPSGISHATKVAVGHDHVCVLEGGAVKCWGLNNYGQLGDGTTTTRTTPVSTGITNAVDLSSAGYYTCAVLSSGAVQCWGWNGSGNLGDGTTTDRHSPVKVLNTSGTSTFSTAVQVSCGDQSSCLIDSSNNTYCWGFGWHGQLGDGTSTDRHKPVQVVR
jgi:alpha-tubulin suppressor-like RCC1 family protein